MRFNPHARNILVLAALWLLMALLISPAGEFPLNDDWTYSKSVLLLTEKGIFDPGDIPAMTLVSHVLWGSLFCKIAGFSFTVLRFSTLLMALAGTITTYLFLNETTGRRNLSFAGALLIAVNPLYFSLSATFMTDISFYTFMMLALLFYTRALRNDNAMKWIIAGTLFAVAATLTRQPGVFIPAAFAASWLARRRAMRDVVIASIPAIIVVASLALYTHWLESTHRLPVSYAHAGAVLENLKPRSLVNNLFHRGGYMILYGGLFLLPLLALFTPRVSGPRTLKQKLLIIALMILFVFPLLRAWSGFPVDNVMNLNGLGPTTLRDTAILGKNIYLVFPQWLWDIVRSAGVAGGLMLVLYIALRITGIREQNDRAQLPAYLFLLMYAAFLVICNSFFDRYFIPLLPMLLVLISPYMPGQLSVRRRLAAAGLLCAAAFFSISGTRDYLSWNRSRWEALSYLTNEKHISPFDIDGGYEFNGWYETGPFNDTGSGKSWWFVKNDDYVVSFGPVDGYNEMKRFPFRSILNSSGNILVLKKEGTE